MKYLVKVAMTFHKELTIYASSEEEAEDKASEIVMSWNNVEDCEVLEVEEDE
jgi:hypothetical protein